MTGERFEAAAAVTPARLDVESLLSVIEAFPDPRVRETALDLLEAVMGLHRAGLSRILEVVTAGPEGHEVLRRLREDPFIAALLTSHALLESGPDFEARVRAALDEVRPYMHGHGGDVELVEAREGRVWVRLVGACHGCGFSENTLRLGIEQVLRSKVPEVDQIVVIADAARAEALEGPRDRSVGDFQTAAEGKGWRSVARLNDMPAGTVRTLQTDRGAVLLCAAYGRVYAFKDACPEGGGSLDKGTLTAFILKCPCHGHAFDVRSGRGLTRPETALEPVPSAWENGQLRVAV
jgi:Fe-S cluster biogenesis protein NfuA/nitrite reductase/ring-hydroxylating ferredoxin subunit